MRKRQEKCYSCRRFVTPTTARPLRFFPRAPRIWECRFCQKKRERDSLGLPPVIVLRPRPFALVA